MTLLERTIHRLPRAGKAMRAPQTQRLHGRYHQVNPGCMSLATPALITQQNEQTQPCLE